MATIPSEIAALLQIKSQEEITDAMIQVFQAVGYPTTSWLPFGTDRTRIAATAAAQALISQNYIPTLAAAGYILLAAQYAPSWVPLDALQTYNTPQFPATAAQGYMQIANLSNGTYNISAGQLIVQFPLTGNQYSNVNTISITRYATDGYFTALFQSAGTGAVYNDPANQDLTLVTNFPGLSVANPPSQDGYGNSYAISHTGPSQGILGLTNTGGNTSASIRVVIAIPGSVYNASFYFRYSMNGSALSDEIQGAAGFVVPNSGGVAISFTDASGSNPANFYAGDSWQIVIPGDWKVTTGTDAESAIALAKRCVQTWNLQSDIPTEGFYERKARETPFVGNQIVDFIESPDASIGGKVNIVVSGPDGYMSPQVVNSIENYLQAFAPSTTNLVVFTPNTATVDFQGTITVLASTGINPIPPLVGIQNAVQEALLTYIGSVGINGTIKLATVIKLIMEQSGVLDVAVNSQIGLVQLGLIINGGSPTFVDFPFGSSTTYVVPVSAVSGSTLFGFTWIVSNG